MHISVSVPHIRKVNTGEKSTFLVKGICTTLNIASVFSLAIPSSGQGRVAAGNRRLPASSYHLPALITGHDLELLKLAIDLTDAPNILV